MISLEELALIRSLRGLDEVQLALRLKGMFKGNDGGVARVETQPITGPVYEQQLLSYGSLGINNNVIVQCFNFGQSNQPKQMVGFDKNYNRVISDYDCFALPGRGGSTSNHRNLAYSDEYEYYLSVMSFIEEANRPYLVYSDDYKDYLRGASSVKEANPRYLAYSDDYKDYLRGASSIREANSPYLGYSDDYKDYLRGASSRR